MLLCCLLMLSMLLLLSLVELENQFVSAFKPRNRCRWPLLGSIIMRRSNVRRRRGRRSGRQWSQMINDRMELSLVLLFGPSQWFISPLESQTRLKSETSKDDPRRKMIASAFEEAEKMFQLVVVVQVEIDSCSDGSTEVGALQTREEKKESLLLGEFLLFAFLDLLVSSFRCQLVVDTRRDLLIVCLFKRFRVTNDMTTFETEQTIPAFRLSFLEYLCIDWSQVQLQMMVFEHNRWPVEDFGALRFSSN